MEEVTYKCTSELNRKFIAETFKEWSLSNIQKENTSLFQ